MSQESWDYSERRGKMRVPCKIEASLMEGQRMVGAEINNVSVKGMKLMCLGKVKAGAQIQLVGTKQYNQAKIHSVNCRVEWVRKKTPGWAAGVAFLDSAQNLSESWLYWELKSQAIRMPGSDQKRKTFRVKCLVPARITTKSQSLNTRIVNLSPDGALVQTTGTMMKPGEVLTLRFGPIDDLPKLSIKANVASVHVEGTPSYGIKFMTFESGGPKDLQKYLDSFFKSK